MRAVGNNAVIGLTILFIVLVFYSRYKLLAYLQSLEDMAVNSKFDSKGLWIPPNPTFARGMRNNNPGNVEDRANWIGKVPSGSNSDNKGRFAQFYRIEHGIRASYIVLRNYITGRNSAGEKFNTISRILNRWAPSVGSFDGQTYGNHTREYIAVVSSRTGIDPDAFITAGSPEHARILLAMFSVENGGEVPTDQQMRDGIALAG